MTWTNFPNGITSFGVPVFGTLPAIRGQYFFVDPAGGSNGATGKSIKAAVADIEEAYSLCTDAVGDGIYGRVANDFDAYATNLSIRVAVDDNQPLARYVGHVDPVGSWIYGKPPGHYWVSPEHPWGSPEHPWDSGNYLVGLTVNDPYLSRSSAQVDSVRLGVNGYADCYAVKGNDIGDLVGVAVNDGHLFTGHYVDTVRAGVKGEISKPQKGEPGADPDGIDDCRLWRRRRLGARLRSRSGARDDWRWSRDRLSPFRATASASENGEV